MFLSTGRCQVDEERFPKEEHRSEESVFRHERTGLRRGVRTGAGKQIVMRRGRLPRESFAVRRLVRRQGASAFSERRMPFLQ